MTEIPGIGTAYAETLPSNESASAAEAHSVAYDIFTIPNAVTLFRALCAPWGYSAMRDNPGENWKEIGEVFGTDLEGNLGRVGKLPIVGKTLTKLGFRTSPYGAQADPVADVLFGGAVLAGGIRGGAIPRRLGTTMFMQKAYKSGVTLGAKAEGNTLKVSNTGALGEFIGAVALPTFAAAEAQETPWKKFLVKGAAVGLASGSLVLSTLASVSYTQDAGLVELPEIVDHALARLDEGIGKILPGGSREKNVSSMVAEPQRPITNQLLD
jgi:phosphatidylglycerophosphate synthase